MKTIHCPHEDCEVKFKLNPKRVVEGKITCPGCGKDLRLNGWEVGEWTR